MCNVNFWPLLLLVARVLPGNAQNSTNDDAYPVRLIGANKTTEGLVQVRFNREWGSVCSTMFDSLDAAVICRQLGFLGPSISMSNAYVYYGEATNRPLMTSLACRGNESQLSDCDYPGWGTYCSSFGYAGVRCQLDDLSARLGNFGRFSSQKDGPIRLNVGGQWASVCGERWATPSTGVVCRELGYHGPSISYAVWQSDEDAPIYLTGINCEGSEAALGDCAYEGLSTFRPFACKVVHTSCQIDEEEFLRVRLTGEPSGNRGYLELSHNGRWGTICLEDWNESATPVACRELGFPGPSFTLGVSMKDGIFGEVLSDVLLLSIRCEGDEERLANCRLAAGSVDTSCKYQIATGIMCQEADKHPVRLVGGRSGNRSGMVEVSFGGHWLTVAHEPGFEGPLASVVCRQLGLIGRNASVDIKTLAPAASSVLATGRIGVACTGREDTLAGCPFRNWKKMRVTSGVICQIGDDLPVRIVGGSSNATGSVQMMFNGVWSDVCEERMDVSRIAEVVCRQLGFNGRAFTVAFRGPRRNPNPSITLQCQGTEGRLDECLGPRMAICGGIKAGVACIADGDLPIQLAGGSSRSEGRVEILLNGVWGTVCDKGWDSIDAQVVCRQLGFGGASLAVKHSSFGEEHGLIYMADVNCVGDEDSLQDCPFVSPEYFFECTWFPATAGVVCQADGDFPVRLTGSALASEGRVEISFRGQWGGICSYGWDEAETDVVCRQLGFHHGTNLVVAGGYYRDDDLPSHLADLQCRGNESNLADCLERSGNVFGNSFCVNQLLVGVKCQTVDIFPVRLVNGFSAASGNVEVFFDGAWGGVCTSGWDIQDASVVCHQLGYDGAEAPVYGSLFGAGPNYHLNGINCIGNERRLANCPLTGWKVNVGFCSHNAGVICKGVLRDEGQCLEEVTYTDIGFILWPATQVGSTAESFQRCLLNTEKAGEAKVTRRCANRNAESEPSASAWEEPLVTDCGATAWLTGKVMKAAWILANTNWSVDEIVDILLEITTAGSGEIEVAESIVDIVNDLMFALRDQNPTKHAPQKVPPAVIESLELQMRSTFHALGAFRIQRERVYVETFSVNSSQAESGFSLAVLQRGQRDFTEIESLNTSTSNDSEVRVYPNGNDKPTDESVRMTLSFPNTSRTPNTIEGFVHTPAVNVTLILYEDDILFQSPFKVDSSLTLVDGVVSVEIEAINLTKSVGPVLAEFRAAANGSTDEVECVTWDFSLGNATGDWSTTGCRVDERTSGRYTCRCNRSSNLAVLIRPSRREDLPRSLDLISQISCIGSAGSCLLVITMYLSLRKLRGSKSGHIFIQFLFSLLMLYSVFAAGAHCAESVQHVCTGCALALHYLPLTTIMWTAVQSRKIYDEARRGSLSTDTCCRGVLQTIVAWVCPLIIVAASFAIARDQYTDNYCVIEPSLPMYISLLLPIALVLAHNLVTAFMTMHHLRRAKGDGGGTRPTGLRLAVAVGIWTLLVISLCSGYLSVHTTARAVPFILASASCLQIIGICGMTSLHWSEGEGSTEHDTPRDCPENSSRQEGLSAPVPDQHDQATTESEEVAGCSSVSERGDDAMVTQVVENPPQPDDTLTKTQLNPQSTIDCEQVNTITHL